MEIRKAAYLTIVALSACSMEYSDEAAIESASTAVRTSNRVVLNRVVLNSLSAAALSSASIAQGAIADGTTMTFNADYDPTAASGDLLHQSEQGRDVLDYIVRCALGPDETIAAHHAGQTYLFHGALGLARGWIARALTPDEQGLVAACLYAHVNHFGIPVAISMRFPGTGVGADPVEVAEYPVLEGAFMGEYFVASGADIELYACQGDSYDVASVNSDDRDERVCTDAGIDSGFTVVGRCREVCESYEPGYGWRDCWADGVKYEQVANVFLRAHDPDGANATCAPGDTCTGPARLNSGRDKSAVLIGQGAADVEARCGRESVCIVDATEADVATVKVKADAIAEVNCAGATHCAVKAHDGASVEINCREAGTCSDIVCQSGASCLLQCDTGAACGFAQCDVGVIACNNGAFACNADCQ